MASSKSADSTQEQEQDNDQTSADAERNFEDAQWSNAVALMVSDELLVFALLYFAFGAILAAGLNDGTSDLVAACAVPPGELIFFVVACANFPTTYLFLAFVAFLQIRQKCFGVKDVLERKYILLCAAIEPVAHSAALACAFYSTGSFQEFRAAQSAFQLTQLSASVIGSLLIALIVRLPWKVTVATSSFGFVIHGVIAVVFHGHLCANLPLSQPHVISLAVLSWAACMFVAYSLHGSQYDVFEDRRDEVAMHRDIVAHAFRTPLHGMEAMIEAVLLDKSESMSERARDRLLKAKNGCEMMKTLVNDTNALSQLSVDVMLQPSPVAIADCLGTSVELVRPLLQPGVSLACEIDPDVPTVVVVDQTRLSQVLIHLMTNALKFTMQGHVKLGCSLANGSGGKTTKLCFKVQDTGSGIELEQQEEIRSRNAGDLSKADGHCKIPWLGPGHSVCEQLVQALGGEIEFVSRVGIGSSFMVVIPVVASDAGSTAKAAAAAAAFSAADVTSAWAADGVGTGEGGENKVVSASGQSLNLRREACATPLRSSTAVPRGAVPTIVEPPPSQWRCTRIVEALVCEDVPLNMDALLSQLEQLPTRRLRVVTAHNGEDALAKFYKRKRPFDVIFMDCSMPVMNGFETSRCIRNREKARLSAGETVMPAQIIAVTAGRVYTMPCTLCTMHYALTLYTIHYTLCSCRLERCELAIVPTGGDGRTFNQTLPGE
jgi:CheY-like chemotaxis protein